MGLNSANLAALVGSRICHDLISPVGAINNGLELLGMSNSLDGPELELIADSVNNANSRIRFFRIAFGAAGEQQIGRAEIMGVLTDVSKGSRVKYNWLPQESADRRDIRMALLAGLCLETALPYGGSVEIARNNDRWSITGEGRKFNVDDTIWSMLTQTNASIDEAALSVTPSLVQFPMLAAMAEESSRNITYDTTADKLTVTF